MGARSHITVGAPWGAGRIGSPAGGIEVPSLVIGLSEPRVRPDRSLTDTVWRIEVNALTETGIVRVGSLRTAPLTAEIPAARAVGFGCCPGAFAWDVFCRPLSGLDSPFTRALLSLDTHPMPWGGIGLTPSNGSLLLGGNGEAGAYNHAAGVAPGAVAVPSGAQVDAWSLQAGPGGVATCAIVSPVFGALPLVTVPASSSFMASPLGLVGPVTLTFAGDVAARFVAWRQLG